MSPTGVLWVVPVAGEGVALPVGVPPTETRTPLLDIMVEEAKMVFVEVDRLGAMGTKIVMVSVGLVVLRTVWLDAPLSIEDECEMLTMMGIDSVVDD